MTSPSDPATIVLTRPCPNPACFPVLGQARAYVQEKLQDRFLPSYAALGATPVYQEVRQALGTALAMGDLDATKEACRNWCRLVIVWTREHHEAREAA